MLERHAVEGGHPFATEQPHVAVVQQAVEGMAQDPLSVDEHDDAAAPDLERHLVVGAAVEPEVGHGVERPPLARVVADHGLTGVRPDPRELEVGRAVVVEHQAADGVGPEGRPELQTD